MHLLKIPSGLVCLLVKFSFGCCINVCENTTIHHSREQEYYVKMARLNNVEYIYITEKGNEGIFAISLLSNKPRLSTNSPNERLNNTLFSVFLVVTFLSQQLLVFLLPHLPSTHRHLNMIGVLHLLLVLGGDRIAIRIQQLSRNSKALSITPLHSIHT